MKKKIAIILALAATQLTLGISNKTKAVLGAALVGAGAGVYGIYRQHKQPPQEFKPTLKNINALTFVPTTEADYRSLSSIDELVTDVYRGNIKDKSTLMLPFEKKAWEVYPGVKRIETNTIFIVSRGYMRANKPGENDNYIENGGGATSAYAQITDHLVHGPCVTFDYPDDWQHFSFGQEVELSCLALVYEEVRKEFPEADIVLIGDCRGGKSVLELATLRPEKLKAIVLMSPFVSAQDLTQQIAKSYISWLPKSQHILYGFFKWYYPQYDECKDNLLDRLKLVDPELPLLIVHRMHDTLISNEGMQMLVNKLKNNGNKLWFLPVEDKTFNHSRLTGLSEVQQVMNAFFANLKLPHHPDLAEKGQCKLVATQV